MPPSSTTRGHGSKRPNSADDSRLVAQSSPGGLGLATNPRFRYDPHVELLDETILDVIAGKLPPRLVVEMPPRHGKSEMVSKNLPAWFIGTFPDKRVILTSYEADFAATWGQKARDLLEQYGRAYFGVQVSERSKASKRWDLAGHDGGMVTAGAGGPITGKGADLLIIDDPVKNDEEALSETMRDKHWSWWQGTASNRLEPGAIVIVMMTRWHEEDLIGKLLTDAEEGGEKWHRLRLPALAEKNDPLGREHGKALWSWRYDEEALAGSRLRSGAYWFAAQFQQRPRPLEGGIFKERDHRYWTKQDDSYILHDDDGKRTIGAAWLVKFATVDVADSESKMADYTVCSTWGVTPERDVLLLGRERVRFEGTELPRVVRGEYDEYEHAVLYVERNMYGRGLIKALLRQGLPIEPVDVDTDKVTRALSAAPLYEAHKIFHPRGAPWLKEWEEEHTGFPNAAHDDQVDTTSIMARVLPKLRIEGRKQKGKGKTVTGGLLSQEM